MDIPIKDLPSQYGIGKTMLYKRFNHLGITPKRRGKLSYITQEELDEMDRLDGHLKSGGVLEEFQSSFTPSSEIVAVNKGRVAYEPNDTLQLIEAIARHFSSPIDPLREYKALEYAVEHKLLLPTSKVRELIGVKPQGKEYTRGSFRFVRAGKIGGQAAWKVERL